MDWAEAGESQISGTLHGLQADWKEEGDPGLPQLPQDLQFDMTGFES